MLGASYVVPSRRPPATPGDSRRRPRSVWLPVTGPLLLRLTACGGQPPSHSPSSRRAAAASSTPKEPSPMRTRTPSQEPTTTQSPSAGESSAAVPPTDEDSELGRDAAHDGPRPRRRDCVSVAVGRYVNHHGERFPRSSVRFSGRTWSVVCGRGQGQRLSRWSKGCHPLFRPPLQGRGVALHRKRRTRSSKRRTPHELTLRLR